LKLKLNLSILKAIAKLLHSDSNNRSLKTGPLNKVVPALRLFGVIFIILLCALSNNAYFTYIVIALAVLHLSVLPIDALKDVLKVVLSAVLFSGLILLPSIFMGSPGTFFTVLMKVVESVMLLATLNAEVDWKDITASFRALKVPSVFVLTLDLTVKFLVILGRFSDKLLEAVTLRSVGKRNWKTSGAGDILGTTFLKSTKVASRTSEAMACRCFVGEYRSFRRHKWNVWDGIYVLGLIVLTVVFALTVR
jgi:cobalt/nickel transport system permease protein